MRCDRSYVAIVPLGEVETHKVKVADLGMWTDCGDMTDPVAYVSEIRQKYYFK